MIVTNTTDSIDIVLGANVTTNQLHIVASYNKLSSSTVTPFKSVTATSNTTAVKIVPSPSSNQQHQLRYCSIFNSDSAIANVTIRTNYNGTTRNVISVSLFINETLQYTHKTGWKVFDMNGAMKNINGNENTTDLNYSDFVLNTSTTTDLSLGTTTYCYYIGRATGSYKTIVISYILRVGLITPTWAEIAIYKGSPSIGAGSTITRCGVSDMSTFWLRGATNMAGIIDVTGVNPGDDLWFVIGNSASTSAQFRVNTIADDIGAGFIQTSSSNRPSINSTLTTTVSTSSNVNLRFGWAGF